MQEVEKLPVQFNQEVIDELESLLQRAKTGEIQGLICSLVLNNRRVESIMSKQTSISIACFALTSLIVDIQKLVAVCDENED